VFVGLAEGRCGNPPWSEAGGSITALNDGQPVRKWAVSHLSRFSPARKIGCLCQQVSLLSPAEIPLNDLADPGFSVPGFFVGPLVDSFFHDLPNLFPLLRGEMHEPEHGPPVFTLRKVLALNDPAVQLDQVPREGVVELKGEHTSRWGALFAGDEAASG